ncbi:MAG TPA: dTDP-4-dehydrorhamnose 3,5-epimerase [Burkholderiales bacterium]
MKFTPLPLPGAYLIEPEPVYDARGMFARVWCRREFEAHGLSTVTEQCSVSFNPKRGTLRGLHYQAPPHEEVKLVRCTRGAVYDVVLDLRPGSPAFGRWFGIELTAENRRMLYIPEGVAHGFLTRRPGTEVYYQMSAAYVAEAARGVRWNDPAFGIAWPGPVEVISERDASYPDFAARATAGERQFSAGEH